MDQKLLHRLGLNDFKKIITGGKFTVKQRIWQGKKDWNEVPCNDIVSYFNSLNKNEIISGTSGLWMQPYVYYRGIPLFMCWMDVEHPEKHHTSISANIQAGRGLYYLFSEMGLGSELIVGLSGKGLRFVWPWLIPYQYSKAFSQMVKDSKRFPGIDPAPQTGTNKFFRTFAYRGHKSQNTPVLDAHIHYLEQASDLLELTEEKYKRLTQGPPSVDHYTEVLPKLIPNDFAPDALWEILEQYNFQLNIRSTIATPGPPRINGPGQRINWEQIFSHINSLGIKSKKHDYNSIEIIKLHKCPVCGKKEGKPYVTPSGRLKCFRSLKCHAGQQERGLGPSEWVPEYDGLEAKNCEPERSTTLDLTEAREKLAGAMNTNNSLCINATPGVGKTYQGAHKAATEGTSKLVLYTAPTLALCQEIKEIIEAINPQLSALVLEGRNQDTCENISEVSEVCDKGFSPAKVLCYRCDHRKACNYLKQFKDIPQQGVVLATHKMATLLPKRISPGLWICDESPVMDFFRTRECTQLDMDALGAKEAEYDERLIQRIKEVAFEVASKITGFEQGRIYVGQTPPGVWEDAVVLDNIDREIGSFFEHRIFPREFSQELNEIKNEGGWEFKVFKHNMDMNAVRWWEEIIKGEESEAITYIKIYLKDGVQIVYTTVEYCEPRFENCQVIHLDGTMYKPEVEMLFNKDMLVVDAQVDLESCNKVHFKLSRGKYKVKKLNYSEKHRDIKMLIEKLRPQDKKVLLLTYKSEKKEILEIARAIRPDLEFDAIHFWGPRGINEFQDYDACVSYGTPTVGSNDVADHAMYFFEEVQEQQEWTASLGHRELSQAVHRIRPVNGDKNIIIMGSYWPSEYLGEPDLQIDMMRQGGDFQEAKRRLLAFAREYKFLNMAVANMLIVGTEKDENAVKAWQARIARGKGGPYDRISTLINIIYKSEERVGSTPPAILLRGNNQWKKLLEEIRDETGLESYWYSPLGRGGRSMALGNIEMTMQFYNEFNSVFADEQYKAA